MTLWRCVIIFIHFATNCNDKQKYLEEIILNNKQKKFQIVLFIIIPRLLGIIIASTCFTNEFLIDNLNQILIDANILLVGLFCLTLVSLFILLNFKGNEKTMQIRESWHYKKILYVHLLSVTWLFLGLNCLFVCHLLDLISKTISWILILIMTVSFIYSVIVLFYLTIMISTLFVKKKKYF